MAEAALIGQQARIDDVYSGGRRERLAAEFDLHPPVLTERFGDVGRFG